MAKLYKWQHRALANIYKLNNAELLNEVTSTNPYDDSTSNEIWVYNELEKELNKRLIEIGFLMKDENDKKDI